MRQAPESAYAGRTIVITGASSGIGHAFARHLAAAGAELVLVARRTGRLGEIATALRAMHDVPVHVVGADLAMPGAAGALYDTVHSRGLQIDMVINNAGIGSHGDLATTPVAVVANQIQLNITALTELTALLLPDMLARGRGGIVNIASTAAFQPVPHMAVYAATKAYVLSFTRALWAETRHTGVRVVAVCPGATDTEFFDTAGEAVAVGSRRDPGRVVETALRALARRGPSVVDGRLNTLVAALAPRLPARTTLAIAERSVRPRGTEVSSISF